METFLSLGKLKTHHVAGIKLVHWEPLYYLLFMCVTCACVAELLWHWKTYEEAVLQCLSSIALLIYRFMPMALFMMSIHLLCGLPLSSSIFLSIFFFLTHLPSALRMLIGRTVAAPFTQRQLTHCSPNIIPKVCCELSYFYYYFQIVRVHW